LPSLSRAPGDRAVTLGHLGGGLAVAGPPTRCASSLGDRRSSRGGRATHRVSTTVLSGRPTGRSGRAVVPACCGSVVGGGRVGSRRTGRSDRVLRRLGATALRRASSRRGGRPVVTAAHKERQDQAQGDPTDPRSTSSPAARAGHSRRCRDLGFSPSSWRRHCPHVAAHLVPLSLSPCLAAPAATGSSSP
jgi:hypothetical protein